MVVVVVMAVAMAVVVIVVMVVVGVMLFPKVLAGKREKVQVCVRVGHLCFLVTNHCILRQQNQLQ